MSLKLNAMLSEVESLIAAATISAKKKPAHAVEKDSKGNWRIRSLKDGKLWPQTYGTQEKANKGLAAYHLLKKAAPSKGAKAAPKKAKASAECPECGSEASLSMSGLSCPECGWNDSGEDIVEASAECPECGDGYDGNKCESCGCETKASTEKPVKAAEEAIKYESKDKLHLRKMKRLVDRGYLSPDEIAGALMEALRLARVSTRMAGAIAQKVKDALSNAEEDVVDVSARARRR